MRPERGDPSKRMSRRQLVRGRKCGSRVGVRGRKEERTRRTASRKEGGENATHGGRGSVRCGGPSKGAQVHRKAWTKLLMSLSNPGSFFRRSSILLTE